MKIGSLVYDSGIDMRGLIIEIIPSVVPYRIFYEDGSVDIACAHDLEVIDGILRG